MEAEANHTEFLASYQIQLTQFNQLHAVKFPFQEIYSVSLALVCLLTFKNKAFEFKQWKMLQLVALTLNFLYATSACMVGHFMNPLKIISVYFPKHEFDADEVKDRDFLFAVLTTVRIEGATWLSMMISAVYGLSVREASKHVLFFHSMVLLLAAFVQGNHLGYWNKTPSFVLKELPQATSALFTADAALGLLSLTVFIIEHLD